MADPSIHKIDVQYVYIVKRGVCECVKDLFCETERKIMCGVQSIAELCVDGCHPFLTTICIVQSNMYKKKKNINDLDNSERHFIIQNHI